MRQLALITAATSGEAATNLLRRLEEQYGKPFIVEEVMEPNAIERLRELSEKINR